MTVVSDGRENRPGAVGRELNRYEAGQVAIARGSTVLRGQGTAWRGLARPRAGVGPKRGFVVIEGGEEIYEVHLVNSDTLITLKRPFARADVASARYSYYETAAEAAVAAAGGGIARAAGAEGGGRGVVHAADEHVTREENPIKEIVLTIVYALLIALVIRAFLYQPFNIPSGSMVPTLLEGDYIFVSKFAYGYSRHSLPFSPPLFSGRLFGTVPERGDVVVFKLPSDGHTDYIKRVVGLPGDRLQMREGILFINGKSVDLTRTDDFVERDLSGLTRYSVYRETLPNGVSHATMDASPNGQYDNTGEYVVPQGHVFVMGDNRDNSLDSRVAPDYDAPRQGGVGYVPLENLVGRAEVIFFSTDGSARFWQFWRWPSATRWDRLFERVH